jgi:hypothetical protein
LQVIVVWFVPGDVAGVAVGAEDEKGVAEVVRHRLQWREVGERVAQTVTAEQRPPGVRDVVDARLEELARGLGRIEYRVVERGAWRDSVEPDRSSARNQQVGFLVLIGGREQRHVVGQRCPDAERVVVRVVLPKDPRESDRHGARLDEIGLARREQSCLEVEGIPTARQRIEEVGRIREAVGTRVAVATRTQERRDP